MKQFNGYKEAKKSAQFSGGKLPEGAYICKILNVKYMESADSAKSDMIELSFDIAEGEQKDFFKNQYASNPDEDKKWKGRTIVYVPIDDGSEKDGWTKNAFAKWTDSFEKSNNGYAWDWDEQKWKNKLVGIVFGTTGTVLNGKEITYTEARFPVSVDVIKSGKAPTAKFKAKNGYTGNSVQKKEAVPEWVSTAEDEEDGLPFNI